MPFKEISNLRNPLYYYMLKNKSDAGDLFCANRSIYLYPVLSKKKIDLECGTCLIESFHIRVPEEYNRLNYYNNYHYTLHVTIAERQSDVNKQVIHIYVASRPKAIEVSVRNVDNNNEILLSEQDKKSLIEFAKNQAPSCIESYYKALQDEIEKLFDNQEYILGFDNPDLIELLVEKARSWLEKFREFSAMGVFCKKLKPKAIESILKRNGSLSMSSQEVSTPSLLGLSKEVECIETKDKPTFTAQLTLFKPNPQSVEQQRIDELATERAILDAYHQQTQAGKLFTPEEAIEYHDTSRAYSFLRFLVKLDPGQEDEIENYIEDSTIQCTKLMERLWYSTTDHFCCLRTNVDQRSLLSELALRSNIYIPNALSRNDPLKAFISMRSPQKIDWFCKYCEDRLAFSLSRPTLNEYMELCVTDKRSKNDGFECFITLLRNGFRCLDFYEILRKLKPILIKQIGENSARMKLIPFAAAFDESENIHNGHEKKYKFLERFLKNREEYNLLDKSSPSYTSDLVKLYSTLVKVVREQYNLRHVLFKELKKAFPENFQEDQQRQLISKFVATSR